MFSRRLIKTLSSRNFLPLSKNRRIVPSREHHDSKNATNIQLLSGIQPTGNIHLGNYFGAIHQWVEFQEQPELIVKHQQIRNVTENQSYNYLPPIIEIVDLHSLTTGNDPQKLNDRIFQVLAVILGCGIDPKTSIVFKQSSIPYHGHLCWILSTLCTLPQLSRFPQFKDKSSKFKEAPLGLFLYPVLQTADILLYKGTHIPIGDDQLAHLNLAKMIATKFNSTYNTDLFPIPLSVSPTDPGAGRIKSLRAPDKKMSKSELDLKSRIELLDSPDDTVRKIMKSVTDMKSEITYDPDERPGVSNLIRIYSIISGLSQEEICQLFVGKETVHLKIQLAELLVEYLRPIRDNIVRYSNDRAYLETVLVDGAQRAMEIAENTIEHVHESLGTGIANISKVRQKSRTENAKN